MNILTVEGITKKFGEKVLFDNISIGISTGDKIGVIGINGTGKSTLLKIIAGVEEADSGQIVTMNGIKIAYLPQIPVFDRNSTVIDYVFDNGSPIMSVIKEYEEIVAKIADNANDDKLNKRIIELNRIIDGENAWNIESDAKNILTKLGISDFYKDVSLLSGGQKKRVAIAAALIAPVELIILDEPTNHIDNETAYWLESYLEKSAKSLIMVTHDRYFLDRVANKTIELDKGKLYTYDGNYSDFLQLKAEREEIENASERKRRNFLRNELEWVRRGAKARTTKQKARLDRFNQISDINSPAKKENVEIGIGASRLGTKTIILENISKFYDGICYIDDFSYIIGKNDRVGIIGENGKGKSTLLKIMTGEVKPDNGFVEIGKTVKVGIFAQENDAMDENKRVIEYIKDVAEFIETGNIKISASQMLEKFLFNPEMQWSPISKLSGGEKRRLYLLKVLMGAPNILFLDEPTNDLDIETLTILEEYLDDFSGAVVTVSHDRYFLDKCVDRIFAFENGKIKQYEGGYSDYIEKKEQQAFSVSDKNEKNQKEIGKKSWDKGKKAIKMSFKEQKEFEQINNVITELENKITELEKEISSAGADYVKLQELTTQKEETDKKLNDTLERWVYLNELAEKIENEKKQN